MVVTHHVEGYENFINFMKDFKSDEPIFVLYMGSKLEDGNSWCSDCVIAHPFIDKGIESAPDNYQYIVVEVGDRPFWKDMECPFRTNPQTRLRVLPTMVRWGTQKRLEGDDLLKSELIEMLLTEDND